MSDFSGYDSDLSGGSEDLGIDAETVSDPLEPAEAPVFEESAAYEASPPYDEQPAEEIAAEPAIDEPAIEDQTVQAAVVEPSTLEDPVVVDAPAVEEPVVDDTAPVEEEVPTFDPGPATDEDSAVVDGAPGEQVEPIVLDEPDAEPLPTPPDPLVTTEPVTEQTPAADTSADDGALDTEPVFSRTAMTDDAAHLIGAGEAAPTMATTATIDPIGLSGDPTSEAEYWFEQSENGTCVPSSIAQIVAEFTGEDQPNEAVMLERALELNLIEYGEGQAFGNWSGMNTVGAVELLESFGVPAHVETGTAQSLAAYLADGRDIMVTVDSDEMRTGLEGQVRANHALIVSGIDLEDGLVYLSDPLAHQAVSVISLQDFMNTWSDGNFEMVVTDHAAPDPTSNPDDEPGPETPTPTEPGPPETAPPPGETEPGFVLLPVTLDADDTMPLDPDTGAVAQPVITHQVTTVEPAPPQPIDLSLPASSIDSINDLFEQGNQFADLASIDEVEALFRDEGIDGRVDTGQSMSDLEGLLDDGENVVVAVDLDELLGTTDDDTDGGTGADTLVSVKSIDTERGVIVLEREDGSEIEVSIDTFRDAWDDSDHALVKAAWGEDHDRAGLLPSGEWAFVLVPVVIGVGAASAVAVRGMKRS